MAIETNLLSSILAQDPREVLRRMGDYGHRYGFGKTGGPDVTVHMGSGASLSGQVVRCDADRGIEFVLLREGDETDPSLIYLRLDDVSALQVRRSSAVLEMFGASTTAHSGAGPTRLQLKRQLDKTGEDLKSLGKTIKVEYQWPPTDDKDNVRFGLSDLAQALDKVIKRVAGQPIGSAALDKIRIIRIRHEAGARLSATRATSEIDIVADLGRPPASDLDTQLQKNLESVL